jgi:hypothetical protein
MQLPALLPASLPALPATLCRCHLQVQAAASASGTGVLQKLARVFKEKAQQDLDRIVKGTSKTREKLGVRRSHRRRRSRSRRCIIISAPQGAALCRLPAAGPACQPATQMPQASLSDSPSLLHGPSFCPLPVPACLRACLLAWQVIEELFTYWRLEDADETLEELEDALIVSVGGWSALEGPRARPMRAHRGPPAHTRSHCLPNSLPHLHRCRISGPRLPSRLLTASGTR